MNKLFRQRVLHLALTISVGMIASVACSTASSTPTSVVTSASDLLARATLQVEDFSPGWRMSPPSDKTVDGVPGRIVGFHGSSDPDLMWVLVGQELYSYSSAGTAAEAYPTWVKKYLPMLGEGGWQQVSDWDFPNQATQKIIACLPVKINGNQVTSCTVVAQYQNLIVIVDGNLTKDRWLTVEGFRNLLASMDRRVVEALKSQ
jgi:hypothetical protein